MRATRASTEKAMERLSTGLKINHAGDDAAGLAISSRMTSQIKGLNMAVKNAQDGISLTQTAEGALGEVQNMLQRMRELSLQAASDTNSGDDRAYLQTELKALSTEIDRVAATTTFNNQKLFSGSDFGTFAPASGTASVTNPSTVTLKIQVGSNTGASDKVSVTLQETSASVLGVTVGSGTGDLKFTATSGGNSAAENALQAVQSIDAALKNVTNLRSSFGAIQNRLEHTVSNLTNIATNTELARSRIEDADYAQETSNMTRGQILQQAGTAMLAQANKMSQGVMSLLQ
jgi:flagellin